MTGMDVLRRCAEYEKDVRRMKTMLRSTRDAMTRVTRPTDAQGHGGAGDKLGSLTARADEIERGMAARREAYDMELVEALRLVGTIDAPDVSAVMYAHYVSGDTYAAIAVGQNSTDNAVRGLRRRGTAIMQGVFSPLGKQERYARLRMMENQAMRPNLDPAWPPETNHGTR